MSLEARERGPEVSYQLALLITGVALAYWVDFGFVQGLDRHIYLWRIPLAMQSCFAIFSAFLLFFLPDTPRWYYARGREAEGDAVLSRLHALPVESEPVQLMRQEIVSSIKEEDDEGKINFWLLFWDNSELQFGRRLRTSVRTFASPLPSPCCEHIVWLSDMLIRLYLVLDQLGSAVPRYQHAGVLLDADLHQPQLLTLSFWHPRWCPQHGVRHCLVSSDLVH